MEENHGALCHEASLTVQQDAASSGKEAHLLGSARGVWPGEEDIEGSSVMSCTLSPQSSFPCLLGSGLPKLRTTFPSVPCSYVWPCMTTFLLTCERKGCVQLPRHLIKMNYFLCTASLCLPWAEQTLRAIGLTHEDQDHPPGVDRATKRREPGSPLLPPTAYYCIREKQTSV